MCSGSYFPPPVKGGADPEEIGRHESLGRAHDLGPHCTDGSQDDAGADFLDVYIVNSLYSSVLTHFSGPPDGRPSVH